MLQATTTPLADIFDVVLFDLDGVVYLGADPIEGAAVGIAAVRAAGGRTAFVTNNSSREPSSVADQLTAMGIPTPPADVVSSAHAAAAILADALPTGARVLVVGGAGLREAVAERGFEVVDSAADQPVAVAQGFDRSVAWPMLAEAAYAVAAGAMWVATNSDLSLPTERGFAPGNGALVATVALATGKSAVSAGKPEPALYLKAVEACGGGRGLMVGDRLETDIAGASRAGLPSMAVLTGVTTPRDLILAVPSDRPTYIGSDLRDLTVAHPDVVADGAGWRCRSAHVVVRDGLLTSTDSVNDGGVGLDWLRAACVAAWTAADAGQPLASEAVPDLVVA